MKPMLASPGTESLLDRKGYYFEAKLDGIRALCFKKTKLKFTSRNEKVITEKYPEFDFFDDILAEECVLDGEIVVYDDKGNPSFQLWGEKNRGSGEHATFVAFDILYLDGKPLVNEPLYVRKKILEKVVREGPSLQISFYTKNGRDLWKMVKKRALEGVIAKKDDSSYEFGERSSAWLKIKITNNTDCVVLGYTSEKRELTSLALGFYEDGQLVYAGKAGTGFDDKTMSELKEKLDKLKLDDDMIETEPGVIPVEPVLVVEVNYLELTKAGKLRAPVFVRIRDDKEPKECIIPRPAS